MAAPTRSSQRSAEGGATQCGAGETRTRSPSPYRSHHRNLVSSVGLDLEGGYVAASHVVTCRRQVTESSSLRVRVRRRDSPPAPRDRLGVRSGPGIRVCARVRRLQGLLPLDMGNTASVKTEEQPATAPAPEPAPETKPKKKICCACPDTKKLRDDCIVQNGEDACGKFIEAHLQCLRAEGFNV